MSLCLIYVIRIIPFFGVKHYTLMICGIVAATVSFSQGGEWTWSNFIGGYDNEQSGKVKYDQQGNSYVTGSFSSSTLNIGGITLQNGFPGFSDIFLAKYNPEGNVLWAISFGGNKNENNSLIEVDGNGNIYLTGSFQSPSIMLGETQVVNYSAGPIFYDVFISKLNENGDFIWSKSAGGEMSDHSMGLHVDAYGSVYFSGRFALSIQFGGIELTTNPNAGNTGGFLVKYDPLGNEEWVKGIVGSVGGMSVATDLAGNVYLNGSYQNYYFDYGQGTMVDPENWDQDSFLIKYTTSGDFLWFRSSDGSCSLWVAEMITDVYGNILFTGHLAGNAGEEQTFGSHTISTSGIADMFIVKYDSDGNVLWAKTIGGNGYDRAYGLQADGTGNVYLIGSFDSPSMILNGEVSINQGASDAIVVAFSSNGQILWHEIAGGNGNDVGTGIDISSSGEIFIIGQFGSAPFILGNYSTSTVGGSDIFIAKMALTLSMIKRDGASSAVVYPNPINDRSKVQFGSHLNDAELRIYNSSGELVWSREGFAGDHLNLESENWISGCYYLRVFHEDKLICALKLMVVD